MQTAQQLISNKVVAGFDSLFSEMKDSDASIGHEIYTNYQDDPVAFGRDILGDTYTPDVEAMLNSVRDYEITVAKSANATGKTHGAARAAVWWYKCFPNAQVYTAAAPPESNLKRLLWGEIGSIIETQTKLFKSDKVSYLSVSRAKLVFLEGVTIPSSGSEAQREAKFSGKHAPHILFILDEGDAIPDEVYKGIESCGSGGVFRLLIMFNPKKEVGEAYRMIKDERCNLVELSAFNHPNVITGKDLFPGAVTQEKTVRRINDWCRYVGVSGTKGTKGKQVFDLPDHLDGVVSWNQAKTFQFAPLKAGTYEVMVPAFSYMVLGKYPAQSENQLISKEWTAAARTRWDLYVSTYGEVPPLGVNGTGGLDVAEFGSDDNCLMFRYGGWVTMPVTWGGVDPRVTSDRGEAEFKSRNDIEVINVDAIGVGSGVAPSLNRSGCFAISVKVSERSGDIVYIDRSYEAECYLIRDQLMWAVREWLRTDPGAMLPPDEMLIEELHTPTYLELNGFIHCMKTEVFRELIKRSPDRLTSLMLTFYEPERLFAL